jgi:hypothetical protein
MIQQEGDGLVHRLGGNAVIVIKKEHAQAAIVAQMVNGGNIVDQH